MMAKVSLGKHAAHLSLGIYWDRVHKIFFTSSQGVTSHDCQTLGSIRYCLNRFMCDLAYI